MKDLQLELLTGHAKAKACTKCGEVKPLLEFRRKLKGHQSHCKLCKKTSDAVYRNANREKINKYHAEHYKANREKILKQIAEYQKANREKIAKKNAEYYKTNREKVVKKAVEYAKANPEKHNAKSAKRRATKRNATPPWLTRAHLAEIEAMYTYHKIFNAVMPDKAWQVDHIIPLQGRKAKGIHAPWNMRVIPASENNSKYNKMPPVSEQIAYEKNLLGGIAYQ